jgi:hypothetical protein
MATKKKRVAGQRNVNSAYPQATRWAEPADPNSNRLTTKLLAALILDALIIGGVVREADMKKAKAIICEEIDARKAVGDY